MDGVRRASLAEAYGTFLLTLVGPGTITAVAFADRPLLTSAAGLGVIGLAHGVALLVVFYSIGHISGAHINPAVTVASWATHRLDAKRVAPYIIAQLLGATVAGFLQLALWSSSPISYAAAQQTWLGDSLPGQNFTVGAALLAEVVGTAILVFTIFSATDKKADQSLAGVAIGLVLAAMIWVFGPISGASLNPARTWGPSIASAVFSLAPMGTFWIYVVGPILGGLLGGFLYETIRQR